MLGIVVAYIVTGIAVVWWDARRPFIDRPAYVRDGMLGMIALVIVGWLPTKVMAALQYRLWADLLKALLTFIALAIGAQYLIPTT